MTRAPVRATRAPDAVVVGGGVVGCAVAFELAREGLGVALLERGELAGEASGAAAGMLLPLGEAPGPGPFLALGLRSLALFPALAAELRERSGIDPEHEPCGALHVAADPDAAARLAARARTLAAFGAEWLDASEARGLEPRLGPRTLGAMLARAEAHVRSPLLVRALAAAAAALGARIETGMPVLGLRREGERVVGVETPAGPVAAARVVLCAGAWSPALAPFPLPVEPVRGQILALESPRPALGAIVVGPRCYLVPKRDGSVVVGATEERAGFDARVTAAGLAELLAGARELLPALGAASFRGGWAGLRPATPDGLPAVGPAPGAPGLLVAAGHHRNGVLLAPLTARLVADLVFGKSLPPEAAALAPDRFGPRAA
jgi:glycine oxidase